MFRKGKIQAIMKLRHFLLLPLLALPLYAQTQTAVESKQEQACRTHMSDEDFLNFLTRLLIPQEGYEQQYNSPEEAQQAVQAAAEAFLPAAREAYLAQIEWAQHSVSIISGDYPQECAQALEIYRRELQLAWMRDLS